MPPLNVRLLDAGRGEALWAERFVGKTSSLFEIQDEVVAAIASALPIRLALSSHPRRRSGATDSIAAYDEFLRGQKRYGHRTPDDNRMARSHYERALSLDPSFARAHARLALAWSRFAIDGWTDDAAGALSKALEHVEEATSIDPTIPQIHFVRAQKAAKEFETALERNPAHMRARLWYAATLARLGRAEEAAWEAQELLLLAINPEFSLSRLLLAFPLKDPHQRNTLIESLVQLGLPE